MFESGPTHATTAHVPRRASAIAGHKAQGFFGPRPAPTAGGCRPATVRESSLSAPVPRRTTRSSGSGAPMCASVSPHEGPQGPSGMRRLEPIYWIATVRGLPTRHSPAPVRYQSCQFPSHQFAYTRSSSPMANMSR